MFKFIKEDGFIDGRFPTKVEMTFESDVTWGELLDGFVQFLRGSGYHFDMDVTPTIIRNDDGVDLRQQYEELWEQYAVKEENANTSFRY